MSPNESHPMKRPLKLRLAGVGLGTGIGLGVGYVVGTAAGREQARRLATLAGRAGRSAPVAGTAGLVVDKAAAVSALAVEWLKDLVSVGLGWRNGDEAADAIAVEVADELAHAINGHGSGGLGGGLGLLADEAGLGHRAPTMRTEARRSRRALAQASSR